MALPKFVPIALGWIACILAVYIAGIMLTDLTTIAADLTRYNRPVYPLLLTTLAVLISTALTGARIAVAVAFVGAVLAIHGRSLAVEVPAEQHVLVNEMLNRELQPGMTASAWLLGHVGRGGVILAINGQAVHYVLDRDVIALLQPPFTNRDVDEQGYRTLMTQYRARYLLLFPGLPPTAVPEQDEVPFLRGLAADDARAPNWLRPAMRDSTVAIYECAACAN